MTEKYNGWANYETWAVHRWLSNEEPSYRYWTERAQEAWDNSPDDENVPKVWTREEAARFRLADQLKEELGESMPDLGASLWSDLLTSAMQEVNWDEIAASLIEKADKEPEEPEEAAAE